MRIHFFWLFLLLFWARVTGAQTPAPPNSAASSAGGVATASVEVGGRALFGVTGADETEALRRADLINGRLQRLIERDADVARFAPADLKTNGGAPTLMLGGEEIVTITPLDAAQNGATASQLAPEWGYALSSAVRAARVARGGPFGGVAVTLASSLTDLAFDVVAWVPRLIGAFVLAILFWFIARGVRALAKRATRGAHFDPNLSQLALAVSFYGVWALGFLAILSALGVDSASIAATVGVSGFVLGFAFKDVLSHFFAGLMLLSGRQFTIGGQIQVGDHEGTVESIDLRALRLRTVDNRVVTIPNGDVFNSAVISNTSNPTRRREFRVAIGLEDDARAAIALAARTLRGVEGVLQEPAPQVVACDLAAPVGMGISSVELRCFFYTSSDNPRVLEIQSECILRVKDAFENAGITLPGKTPVETPQ